LKNSNRISKINNLYSKIILCSKEITPEYYSNLRKSLILEKINGILNSEVDFESPDKRYYLFDYEDFRILHSLLSSNKNIQNGIEYIYGISLVFDEENAEKKNMITRLIIKTSEEEYLYMACTQERDIVSEVISNPDDTILHTKLSPKPNKIFNILEYLSDSIDFDVLNNPKKEKSSKEYSFRDFIKETNTPICAELPTYIFSSPRPTIKCMDGFKISVQASSYNNCSPQLSGLDMYKTFEVISSTNIDDFAEYLSTYKYINKSNSNKSLIEYDRVPESLIETLIESHGGINKKETFSSSNIEISELKKLSYAKNLITKAQNN